MSLYEAFGEVEDNRKRSGLRHELQPFLTMITLGIMSGYNGYQELAVFLKSNEEKFISLFGLKHGVPKYTQIRTILSTLNYDSLYINFENWTKGYVEIEQGDWVSGDGKGLNSTVTNCHNSKQNYVAMVSLFLQKLGVVLSVNKYETGKSGEGAALRTLLESIENVGVVITLDALHCQKKQ